MAQFLRYLNNGLIAILLIIFAASPSSGKVIEWADTTQNRQDLFLLGFGEVTMGTMDVSGNADAFKTSNPTLDEDFYSNYRMSLFANGNLNSGLAINGAAIVDSRIPDEYYTVDPSIFRLRLSMETTEPLWDGWRFTGHGIYDPSRQWELENLDIRLLTQPQEPSRLEMLMKLESQNNGYVEGGSLRPSFKGSKFTLHQRSLFGAYADLYTGPVGVEAVGGKLEGKAFREGDVVGIRADGTSGPYDLVNAPITRGSDEVKVEVRDRFDETTVLSSKTLIRDIDYTVDYLLGKITLHQPVASETASSDPVYIVITYDFQRDEDDDLIGGRARVMPSDDITVSGSYLHRNIDNGATGTGIDEPENLMAGDLNFKVEDHTKGYFEIAGSDNDDNNEDQTAVRLGAETEVIKDLKLSADFQRIDDQFRSFTNSDLNPNKNQQRIDLGGIFKLSETQSIGASYADYRTVEANGEFNPYDGRLDEKILGAKYKNKMSDKFGFGLRFERRDKENLENAATEKNHQNRFIANAGGQFEDASILGQLGYDFNYEMIMFRNDVLLGENDANTNQAGITLKSKPVENALIKFTQRMSLKKDKVQDLYDERQDVSLASVHVKPHRNVNTLTTFEYKRYTAPGDDIQLWQSDPTRVQKAGTFAIEYMPLQKIKATGKFTRYDNRQYVSDSLTQSTEDYIMNQIAYFHTHHLSFHGESEYRRNRSSDSLINLDKIWDLTLKTNWNKDRLNEFTIGMIRRWQSQDYQPLSKISSTSYIALLSGSVAITRNIFARGSIKGILLNNPLDDQKTFVKIELGYDSHDWYRVSLGYERIESEIDPTPDLNYTGQGLFVRFSGKL